MDAETAPPTVCRKLSRPGPSQRRQNAANHRGAPMNPLSQIRQIDYTVIFARDLDAMQRFYTDVLCFPITRRLGDGWTEFAVGPNRLALTVYGMMFNDPPTPAGALALQLAFRVAPAEVAACALVLESKGVRPIAPITDQPWGHRTLFFRDPDGNVIEIYAEI